MLEDPSGLPFMPSWAVFLTLALLLAIGELVVPGVLLIWFAFAALCIGILALLVPTLPWWALLLVFAVVSAAAILVGRRFYGVNKDTQDEASDLHNRVAAQIGRRGVISQAIEYDGGRGRVKLGDSTWLAYGPSLAKGSVVEAVAYEGTALEVRPVQED